MDNWGGGFHGGDFNGNGKFDPGDIELWNDMKNGSGYRPGNNNSGCYMYFWKVFLSLGLISGAILFLEYLYKVFSPLFERIIHFFTSL